MTQTPLEAEIKALILDYPPTKQFKVEYHTRRLEGMKKHYKNRLESADPEQVKFFTKILGTIDFCLNNIKLYGELTEKLVDLANDKLERPEPVIDPDLDRRYY